MILEIQQKKVKRIQLNFHLKSETGKWRLGLSNLELYTSAFSNTERGEWIWSLQKHWEDKQSLFFRRFLIDDDYFNPEHPTNELLRTVIIDNMDEIEFHDINLARKKSTWTEEEIESFTTSNKAKDYVYTEIIKINEQNIFQDLESFLWIMRIEVNDVNIF